MQLRVQMEETQEVIIAAGILVNGARKEDAGIFIMNLDAIMQ